MRQLSINAVRSEALFVSALQRSDDPGAEQVRQAIAGAVRELGSQGCAARVAQEFGDHPWSPSANRTRARCHSSSAPVTAKSVPSAMPRAVVPGGTAQRSVHGAGEVTASR